MTPRTLGEMAAAMKGALTGDPSALPAGHSIDSRTLKPGDLFYAIKGPRHDAHRFVPDAIARGAGGAVVADAAAVPAGPGGRPAVPVIVVADTLRALQDLAAAVRRSLPVKVVGITGSSGKTTTKEMTRRALETSFVVHASKGNLNNLFGCPLSLLELEPRHQVSVLEMGMSYPGELARLAEIADPDIGVLTNVSGAHMAHFASLEEVADAKGELFAGMRASSTGVFNNDDERCRRIMGRFGGYAVTFGIERPSDLTGSDYRMEGLDGASFEVRAAHAAGSRRLRVRTRFVGLHHAYNALAALGAGFMLGIDLEAMASRLEDLDPLGMRGRVLKLGQGVRVLDDCYNSNPAAMRSAARVLAQAEPRSGGRRVAVFGDMLELGAGEREAHAAIARELAEGGAGLVVAVGTLAPEALGEAGSTPSRGFASAEEAAGFMAGEARPGDVVLVKGSRGVGLEKVVAALVERFGEE